MGLSFAIPIDVAMNVVKQIQEKGRVTRGRIGVQIQEVNQARPPTRSACRRPSGALVNSVEKGGPADKAGIEAGDIILKVDGRTVNTSSELPRIVTQVKPGTKVTLQVWRKGATKDVAVTVAELKEDEAPRPRRAAAAPSKEKAKPNRMGLVLSDLTDEQKKELEIKNGVVVEDIRGTARGDIQPGDVILAVISRGATIEAKSAEQVNATDRQAGEGRVGDLPAAARRAAVLLDDQARQRQPNSGARADVDAGSVRLTLLVRAYCHLCDDMRAALAPIDARTVSPSTEIDVDADPALEARWGDLVPVLLARRPRAVSLPAATPRARRCDGSREPPARTSL